MIYSILNLFVRFDDEQALLLRERWLKWVGFPLLGIKSEVKGEIYDKPALYVANHRSFTDPLVICRWLRAFVVAKAEVANYPIISQGAKLTGVLFVKREDKNSRQSVRQKIIDTINSGQNVLVFPEGTVSVKQGTLPFRRGAFAEAIKHNIPIVPMAVEYRSPQDLWLIPNFVKQFLTSYAKPKTEVKLSIGKPILERDVDVAADQAQSWITQELLNLQKGWTKIDFSKYDQ